MDMNYIERLLKLGYILTEADNGNQGQKVDKSTDKDRYFRLIEDELKDYFSFPGFTLDDSIRTSPDVHLGHGALSAAAQQQQAERLNAMRAEGNQADDGAVDADEELESSENGYRLSEYLRVYITGLFVHPDDVGGWGIGNSQTARAVLERIADDPSLRGTGGSGGSLTAQMLKNPDSYPTGLKNYIALLSKKFIRGMIRIGFEECGLLSYLLHDNRDILNAVASVVDAGDDGENIRAAAPANWDYDKLYHLAHYIIPQFVLKLMVAPATPTPNCDKALIEQNAAYLGDEDLRIIQSYVSPIETAFDTNLCPSGSKKPATYNDLARSAAAWNFSVTNIKRKATHDDHGNLNVYTPPTDGPISEVLRDEEDDSGLVPRYTIEPNKDGVYQYKEGRTVRREYPSQKFGHWTVVDVDNDQDHCRDNVDILGKGFTVMNDPQGKPYRFWFRGGNDKDGQYDYGVGKWCWTGSYYNNYRNLTAHDRGYMLIHDRVLDPDVMDTKDTGNGSKYDSTAFGVVVAGSTSSGIPGLMKASCFQGRQDSTGSDNRPGADFALEYDKSIVPFGGKFPGIIEYGDWSDRYSDKRSIASAINNSIFCLGLIGKWDGSIQVSNGKFRRPSEMEFYTDELVNLMQKWFPVNIKSRKSDNSSKSQTIKLYKIGDLSTLGRILSDAHGDDFSTKDILLSVFQTGNGDTWHLYHKESSDKKLLGCVLAPANEELRLRNEVNTGKITNETFNDEIAQLPALMYTMNDDGRLVPFLIKKLTVGAAMEMLRMWGEHRERSLPERIGAGQVTQRPDSPEGSDEERDSIQWAPAMKSSGKHRTVGTSSDGGIWINGPETNGEPLLVATDDDVSTTLESKALRSTYVVTNTGEYNIWVTASPNGGADGANEMYIIYVRKNKCKMFKMVGSVLGQSTNAILVNGSKVVLGDLMGDVARLNRQNADRYSMFVDLSDVDDSGNGPVIDGAGLYKGALEDLGGRFPGNVGLGVSNGRVDLTTVGNPVLGTIDWYNAMTLDFVETTEIRLDMVTKTPTKLPRETTI